MRYAAFSLTGYSVSAKITASEDLPADSMVIVKDGRASLYTGNEIGLFPDFGVTKAFIGAGNEGIIYNQGSIRTEWPQ
jgi:hypothetical protein